VGGAALAPKQTRSQTRKDYAQLAERARLLMESQGLTENAASEAVANQAAPDNPESVARGIRRQFLNVKPGADANSDAKASARVGLGVLYKILTDYLESLEKQALDLCHTDEQYAGVTEKVEAVRRLVLQRSAELADVASKDALEQARYLLAGLEDPILTPSVIVQREAQVVKLLLEKVDNLLSSISVWSHMGPVG
jgi:hypothetical protein